MGGSKGRAESVLPEGEVVGGAGEQEHEGDAGDGGEEVEEGEGEQEGGQDTVHL